MLFNGNGLSVICGQLKINALVSKKNMSVKIKAVAKELPQFTKTTDEILPYFEMWMRDREDRFRRKALKIFRNAGVDRRYSIIDENDMFSKVTFEERNNIYAKECIKLAENALKNALAKTRLESTGH